MKHISFFLLFALFLASCKKQSESTKPNLENITESVYASGIIKSKNQYQVFASVAGLVQQMRVKAGDQVKKGDALFLVQNEASKLNADNAQLASDFAQSNLQGARLGELRGAIESAKSKMLNDSLMLVRQRGLWAQQIGSKMELEQRELAYTSSLNNYKAALYRYADLQKQLEFAAAQSRKLLAVSQTLQQDFTIRSQTDGRVYSISKEVGEIVNAQSPVAVIGDAELFVAELQVDENDIARISQGQLVLLTLDSYKGQVFEARVTKIDPYMNERSRTFTIEAEFTQQPPVLYPNLTAEANIVIQKKENALTIPRVYLLNDSTVVLANGEKRKIGIGLKDYQKVEVLSGIKAGDELLKPAE